MVWVYAASVYSMKAPWSAMRRNSAMERDLGHRTRHQHLLDAVFLGQIHQAHGLGHGDVAGVEVDVGWSAIRCRISSSSGPGFSSTGMRMQRSSSSCLNFG